MTERKGPSISAKDVAIGTVMRGNDGAMWHVKKSGKSQRWVRIAAKSVKKSPKKSVRKSPKKSVKKSPKKSVRKSPKKSVKKSPKKSVRKSPTKMYSILVTPMVFDNDTVNANTKKANGIAIEKIPEVKRWFMKYGNMHPMRSKAKIVSITQEGNKLRFVFDNEPPKAYLRAYIDPDTDGNHPIRARGKRMLVAGKI
jgi:hypothetical protein